MKTLKENAAEMRDNKSPWFTVAVSVYNRERMISRCVKSCLEQSFGNFELIVVDDASSDGTKAVLDSIEDSRLVVIQHSENRGLCAARDTGARNSAGKWVITLDSDHTLLPGALAKLYSKTRMAEEDVGIIGSRYIWDTGEITPRFVPEGVIDYIGRMKWVDREGGTDYLCCYRRSLYGRAFWPAHSRKGDHIFQLDLARHTKGRIYKEVLAGQYSEDNSESRAKGLKGVNTIIKYAPDWAWQAEEVLRRHGGVMKQNATGTFMLTVRSSALWHFIGGKRKIGFQRIIKYLLNKPFSVKGLVILGLGLIHGRLLAFIHVYSRNIIKKINKKCCDESQLDAGIC